MRLVGSIDQWARFRLLEEQVIADQIADQLETGTVAEGVDLALSFNLDPGEVHRVCGDLVGQAERIDACKVFVENWLQHSSIAELRKYLEGK